MTTKCTVNMITGLKEYIQQVSPPLPPPELEFVEISTRTTIGEWAIVNLKIGRPLIITGAYTNNSVIGNFSYNVISGTKDGLVINYTGPNAGFAIGHSTAWMTSSSAILIPTDTTILIKVQYLTNNFIVYAYH